MREIQYREAIAEAILEEMDLDETNVGSMEGVFEKLFKN